MNKIILLLSFLYFGQALSFENCSKSFSQFFFYQKQLNASRISSQPKKFWDKNVIDQNDIDDLKALGIGPDQVVDFKVRFEELNAYRRPLPKYDPSQDNKILPESVDIQSIHFMQVNASNWTRDGLYTVLDNALKLRSGELDPETLPRINVWRDVQGRIWTLDHRRLCSFVLSGVVDQVKVNWTKFRAVEKQSYKFSTSSEGKTIVVKVGKGKGIVLDQRGVLSGLESEEEVKKIIPFNKKARRDNY